MHQLNVLILGPHSFISSLVELKPFLKFNLHQDISNIKKFKIILDVAIIHKEGSVANLKLDLFNNSIIKILATNKSDNIVLYDSVLKLPTSVNEINSIIEHVMAKKIFSKNSSIKINEYLLNKNEKKLINGENYIILTEKEIQLLELLLIQKKPILKTKILSTVWSYSPNTDTHTVETHIYRLRKKINDKFSDTNFILNDKDGYYL
ncbi:winged helix-turn-helix domain-containing protein [Pelagibacteraceae bacterium]|nr:winged helix-turn-helix domain-containing protein [Pelagibacteraceae bacterium]